MGNMVRPVGIVALFLSALLSGCIFPDEPEANSSTNETEYPSIWDRHTMEWDTSGSYSLLLEPGPHIALEVQEAFIDVDTSDAHARWPARCGRATRRVAAKGAAASAGAPPSGH